EPDTRFLGILLPNHLMRLPYRQDTKLNGFPYAINEQVGFDGKSGNFLWGNCVFSFAAVAIKSFCKTGWYELMRGCNLDNPASGIVPDFIYFSEYKKHIQSELSTFEDFANGHFSTNLPNHYKANGENPVVMWFNLRTTESMETQFAELGFIPLVPDMKFNCGVFYSCPSLHKHEEFQNAGANANADISSSLHYIMCASRFAHYIKVIGRDKIGGLTSATIVENYLQKWLGRYIKGTERIQNADAEFGSHAPLIDANVSVKESPLKTGVFSIEISLQPRFQSQNVISTIKLFSEIKLRG
ncbi:MAG: type VI secretion system contractile sheath large subunit, partial [Bdellovibrionota bacterium]